MQTTPHTPTVRIPRDDRERAAFERVLLESFGSDELTWNVWMRRIGNDRLRVIVDDEGVRGGLGFYAFGQYWGGVSVPMVGIAGVGVAPEARGRGYAKRFLVETMSEARAQGVPLAALFASSLAVYRSVGFEAGGTSLRFSAPIADLPRGDHTLACAPFDTADNGFVRGLYDARAKAWNGHLARTETIWERTAKPYKGTTRGYVFGPREAPEGYVIYTHAPAADLRFSIVLRDLVLGTAASARRCMALLHDLRSLGEEIQWLGCASDPLIALLPEESSKVANHSRWMLRILDPIRAIAMRGYASDGEAHVDVRDAVFGDVGFRIGVSNGKPEVEPVPLGKAPIRLDVRGLAALYTGMAHPATLAAMGLLEGDRTAALAFARLFSGHEAWLCDWF